MMEGTARSPSLKDDERRLHFSFRQLRGLTHVTSRLVVTQAGHLPVRGRSLRLPDCQRSSDQLADDWERVFHRWTVLLMVEVTLSERLAQLDHTGRVEDEFLWLRGKVEHFEMDECRVHG